MSIGGSGSDLLRKRGGPMLVAFAKRVFVEVIGPPSGEAERVKCIVLSLKFIRSTILAVSRKQGGRPDEKIHDDRDCGCARAGNDGYCSQCADPATWRGQSSCPNTERHAGRKSSLSRTRSLLPSGLRQNVWPVSLLVSPLPLNSHHANI